MDQIEVKLVLPVGPSINAAKCIVERRGKSTRMVSTRETRDYYDNCAILIRSHLASQGLRASCRGPLITAKRGDGWLKVKLWVHGLRPREDVQNFLKLPLDAMEKSGIYKTDSRIDEVSLVRDPNPIETPLGERITVILVTLESLE